MAKEQLAGWLRDHAQISLLILGEFQQMNQLLFHLKSSENLYSLLS